MSADWSFRTLIIAAADALLARQIAETLAGSAGAGMWTTGLSADGAGPVTHYVSTGLITPEFAAMVPEQVWEWQQPDRDEPGAWVQTGSVPGNAAMVSGACAMAEPPLDVSVEDVEGIYSRTDVTEQQPFVAMGRMGLRIVVALDAPEPAPE